MSRRTFAPGALVLLIFFFGACSRDERPTVLDLPPPFEDVLFHSTGEVFLKAKEGVLIGRFYDLSPFDGLWPGITESEASKTLGPPVRVYTENHGRDVVYAYSGRSGTVEVFRQSLDSEGFKGARWFLRWRPLDQRPEIHLKPEIIRILPDLSDMKSINIRCVDGVVKVVLGEGLVTAVLWLRQGPEKEIPAGRSTEPLRGSVP